MWELLCMHNVLEWLPLVMLLRNGEWGVDNQHLHSEQSLEPKWLRPKMGRLKFLRYLTQKKAQSLAEALGL